MSAWRSIAYYWLIGWSQLRIIGHIATTPWVALTSPSCDDAVDDGPSVHTSEYRPLLSLLLATLASSTSPQKPPATYTQVSDFGPHTNSIFFGGGRLIRESDLYASIYGSFPSGTVFFLAQCINNWSYLAHKRTNRPTNNDWRAVFLLLSGLLTIAVHCACVAGSSSAQPKEPPKETPSKSSGSSFSKGPDKKFEFSFNLGKYVGYAIWFAIYKLSSKFVLVFNRVLVAEWLIMCFWLFFVHGHFVPCCLLSIILNISLSVSTEHVFWCAVDWVQMLCWTFTCSARVSDLQWN